MKTALDILSAKEREIWTIGPDETVLAALKEMARHDIGALVVVEKGAPVGLITERNYARNVFLKGRSSPTTSVREVMRSGFVHVGPTRTLDECMALMTEHRVRHLLVLDDGRLIGLLSIGDLVKSTIADREFTIEQLTGYIAGAC